ncbi:hypothetical protein M3Y97_00123600 [Aphelenchoides bicaudatus]|nr:hypothetical protein M3Y97_00123600 [Aphelenchoides bicaudatus]
MSEKFSIILAVAAVLAFTLIDAVLICPTPAIDVGGMKICPPESVYNATADRCCQHVRASPKHSAKSYCSVPYLLPGGGVKCPASHPYDSAKMQCCGSSQTH